MLYNVSSLVLEGIGSTRVYELDDYVQLAGRAREHIAGKVELLRTKDGILVRAQLHLLESEVCSRCIRPLEENVRIEFEEEFQIVTDSVTGDEKEDIDPDTFTVQAPNLLDLNEAVRQYGEVSLEMKPLCRPDCRGLCPRCGSDLNIEPCACDNEAADARWAGLAALASALTEGKE